MGFRLAVAGIVLLLGLLQIRLWVSDDGFREVARLKQQIGLQRAENDRLHRRNQRLEAEIADLRAGRQAVEERARADLGLIGAGETFFIFGEELPAKRESLAREP